jgi:Tfp pilus assembly protein PilO
MEKKLLIAIIIFGLSFVIGLVFCFPKFQQMRAAQQQLTSKEAELEEKKAYFEEIDILSEKLKQYPKELAIIDFALPDDFSLPFLFDFFEKIISKNGLSLTNISQSSVSQSSPRSSRSSVEQENLEDAELGNKLKESRTILSLTGSYSSFKNFLYYMEKSARLIEAENASFSLPQEEGSTINFNLRVKTNNY